MHQFFADLRRAVRALRRQPGFTLVALITLALGIGANTAVFSVLSSVVLEPLPFGHPGRLVRLYTAALDEPGARYFHTVPDILDVREQSGAFASVGVMYTYREVGSDLTARDGTTQRVRVIPVSADYFRTLEATPLLGRTFTADEEHPDVRRILLSHALWVAFAGADPDIVGRTLQVDGEAYEVIGVMRPALHDVVTGDAAAWVPLSLETGGENTRDNHYLSAVARLAPGVSLAQAQARVDAVMARLRQDFAPNARSHRTMRVVPLHADVVRGSAAAVYVLMGAAGLVLLIACLNVANLFLARSLAQTREIAVRTALGAGVARLAGPHLAEGLLLALTGGVVGSAVAVGGVKLLLAVSPESLARAEEVGFDLRLLGFALVTTLLTALVFAAAPAVRATRVDPIQALHEGERGSTSGRAARRARSTLVATQVALALVLLVGAGILMRSFLALARVPLGFRPDHVATFEVHLSTPRYAAPERRIQLHQALLERVREIPGVEAAGAISWLPANGHYHQWGFGTLDATGRRQWADAMVRVVDGDVFGALGIPLLGGRTFTAGDRLDTDPVALIDQSLARTVYGTRDPFGMRFLTGGREFTVIGVVGTVAYEADGTPFPMVYLSHAQFANDRNWALTYVVRTSVPPEQIVAPARRALAALDPALVLYQPRSMDAVLARHRARDRFTLLLMGTFAAIALTLAAVGVYGVLSYTVAQRTHEIGVRMALGARPPEVRALVVRQGAQVAGVGIVTGLGAAWLLSRMLGSLVFGVSPRDPLVFAGVAIVLAGVIGAASYVPARRASRVDPVEAMRG
jgi:putative ABC transport system permease protein